MTTRNCCAGLLLLLAAGGLLTPAWMFAAPKRGSKVPAGLSESDWHEIRGVYEQESGRSLRDYDRSYRAAGLSEGLQHRTQMTSSAVQWRCRATRWWSGRYRGQQRHGRQRQPERQQRLSAGAAYVFVRNGTTWSQQAYLKASNTDANDQFGYSVAVSGDTVVVGARRRGQQRHRRQRQPERQQRCSTRARPMSLCAAGRPGASRPTSRPPTPTQGHVRLVRGGVGRHGGGRAPRRGQQRHRRQRQPERQQRSVCGAAYVFVRSGTTWSQQAYLKASNTERA